MTSEDRRRGSRSAASLRRARQGATVALTAMAAVASAHASESQRRLALDVAILAGSTPADISDANSGGSFYSFSSSEQRFGLMLPGLSAGAWLGPQVALAARISNLWYVPDAGEIVNGYVGIELGYAPSDRWLLAAGAGTLLDGDLGGPDVGVGADLRVAHLPFQLHPSALGFTVELIAGYVDNWFAYSVGAGLLWRL